jgi:hypothetical protein
MKKKTPETIKPPKAKFFLIHPLNHIATSASAQRKKRSGVEVHFATLNCPKLRPK